MRIPTSIDELMWLVAEGSDAGAAEKFCQRYPEFRSELFKRMRIVRDLKGARHESAAPPPFRPNLVAGQARPTWRLGSVAAGVASLAVVALGSYTLAVRLGQSGAPDPVGPGIAMSMRSDAVKPMPPFGPPVVDSGNPDERASPSGEVHGPEMPESPYTKPIAFTLRQVPLEVAIHAVARAAGLRVQIAPGMPSRTVSIEVSGSGPAALAELGNRFGFTAFDQGQCEFLVIPAVDQATASQDKTPTEVEPGTGASLSVSEDA